MNNLYVRDSFSDSYSNLSENIKSAVLEALMEFHNDKLMNSRRWEKLNSYENIYSIRADFKYRIILYKLTGKNFLLLYVDLHNYDWVDQNIKSIKNMSKNPDDYQRFEDVFPDLFAESPNESKESAAIPLENLPEDIFRQWRDKELMYGLCNADELATARACYSLEEFDAKKEAFSSNSQIFLRYLLDGKPINEAIEYSA